MELFSYLSFNHRPTLIYVILDVKLLYYLTIG